MTKLKWIGNGDTLLRKEHGGEKFPVKKGETIEVSKEMANSYLQNAYRNNFEVIEEKTTKAVVSEKKVVQAKVSKK